MPLATSGQLSMPRLSDSMEEGTIVRWLRSPGDSIEAGDGLVEIETDKATVVYEAEASGTIVEIVAEEGQTVAIGEPIAVMDPGMGERVKASPIARRVARELGIELAAIRGSGPGGRVIRADVEAAGPTADSRPPDTGMGETTTVRLTGAQQTVARRMSEAKATAPHFYLSAEVDLSRCVEARQRLGAIAPDGDALPSYNDLAVKACAMALRDFPGVNASHRDGTVDRYARVNVGVAVASNGALLVPTIFDADKKGLRQIAAESRLLAERVRDGEITPAELAGGTFTVSNLGMCGVASFAAIINPPQAAILAVGEIVEKPVIRDGEIARAHLMTVTLSCDHRILSGADAAEFLARVRALLSEPVALAL